MGRTSEKLDEYLKSEGWGLIMRKAAGAVTAYQTIEQNDKGYTVTVKNKKGTYSYTATFDGKDFKYKDNDKDEVVQQAVISDDKKSIVETMEKGKDKKKYITTRWMDNGEMKLKIANAAGKYCVRIFKKD